MNLTVARLKLSMLMASIGIILLGLAVGLVVAKLAFGASIGTTMILGILTFIVILNVIQWLFGPYLIQAAYHVHEVTINDAQYSWLYNLVAEAASYNKISMPKVFIADVPFPNAFAYGSPIAGKRIAFTMPILRLLNREELLAVAGHELGHLKHRDVEVMLAVGLIPALIFYLGYWMFWGGMFGEGNGRNNNGGLILLLGLAMVVVSYLFQFLVLFINRMRESYADVNSATTVPGGAENLQIALAKLTLSTDPKAMEKYKRKQGATGQISSMLFFNSPTDEEVPTYNAKELVEIWKHTKVSPFADFFMDHPHPAKRIQLLEKMKYSNS